MPGLAVRRESVATIRVRNIDASSLFVEMAIRAQHSQACGKDQDQARSDGLRD
jgi:hypothetical protein